MFQYTESTDQSRDDKDCSQHKCNGRNHKYRSPTRGHHPFAVVHRNGRSRSIRSRWVGRSGHGCRRVQVQVQAIEIYSLPSKVIHTVFSTYFFVFISQALPTNAVVPAASRCTQFESESRDESVLQARMYGRKPSSVSKFRRTMASLLWFVERPVCVVSRTVCDSTPNEIWF